MSTLILAQFNAYQADFPGLALNKAANILYKRNLFQKS